MNAEAAVFSSPTAPLQSCTHNTLVLVQELLRQSLQPDGAGSITPLSAHTSANNVLAIHAASMEGIRSGMPEAEMSNYPQGQGWKGQPACGCLSWNFTQGSYRVYSGKKGMTVRAWWHGGTFGSLCTCSRGIPDSNHWSRSERLSSLSVSGRWQNTACLGRTRSLPIAMWDSA